MSDELKRMQAESARLLDEAEDAAEAESEGGLDDAGDEGLRESSEFDDLYASGEEGAGQADDGVESPLDEGVDDIDESAEHGGPTADDAENRDSGDRAGAEGEQGGSDEAPHSRIAAIRRKSREYKRNLVGAEKALQKIQDENEALKKRLAASGEEYTPPPAGFTPEMVDKLRDEYGDDIADVVGALAKSTGVYGRAAEAESGGESSGDAGGTDAGGDVGPASFDALLDEADDSAPIQQLGIWMDGSDAESRAMLARATAVQNQLNQDPDFAGSDPISFYNEVVKRTQSTAKPSFKEAGRGVPAGSNSGGAVDRSVPGSLSEAPGAAPAAGGAIDGVKAMSPKQLAEWHKTATPEAKAALEDAIWG